jgi:uncharacterized RDD family membrane protein YckC
MTGSLTVLTPENAQITYRTAGFSTRLAAFLVDAIIQVICYILLNGVVSAILFYSGAALLGAGSIIGAIFLVLMFLIIFAYPTFFEMRWAGQSPGKKLLGIRVVSIDGSPVTIVASLLRNLLRIADLGILPLSPMLYLVGLPAFITMLISRQNRRIGDFAAGTVVILDRGVTPYGAARITMDPEATKNYLSAVHNIDVLTVNDYRLLRRFVERRGSMEKAVQAAAAEFLVRPMLDKMRAEVTVFYQIEFADIAEILEMKYAEKYGLL